MVYRVYVEKREDLRDEARALAADIQSLLQIKGLTQLRLLNRYDVEGIDEDLFKRCIQEVFSEPQVDQAYNSLEEAFAQEEQPATLFAIEYLPGQFDQRADSAAQCIQLVAQCPRPLVRSAKVYALYGTLCQEDMNAIRSYLINPVESRLASMELPQTLALEVEVPSQVAILEGFCGLNEAGLKEIQANYGLAMDLGDLSFFQRYFKEEEQRDPTITELKVVDTYWSDHCRHTTFHTTIDAASFDSPLLQEAWDEYVATRQELGRTKPIDLMDVGTLAARYLGSTGQLANLDESEEINACTVKTKVMVDGQEQDWLLLFKNETHNHPTEIEPFGGAATCIGGCIRDPLSGRAYVFAAMRLTGAADPTAAMEDTLAGKLPQRTIVTEAARGYSSYGNQIGLATGQVDELYHPGYAAKRMEVGAVLGAAPQANVRRERPIPGDKVILLGGKTGRDGCGGATGSSKSHTAESLESCGAEVQKGNAPEEKKIQRLFRRADASTLIKRCNDFGAGGVSVAIGELADGLSISLNVVPKKYEGLDGTELAISESQERMAVVVAAQDVDQFLALAAEENLEATVVAEVTQSPRLVMSWNNTNIVDLSRAFLDTNGAEKHTTVHCEEPMDWQKTAPIAEDEANNIAAAYKHLAANLNVCSKRGLSERFDSTIGAQTILMPWGGTYQLTPPQAMAYGFPVEKGTTSTCALMAWGYNPLVAEASPYHGAYLAVLESVAKLVATGASYQNIYLSFQEYFGKVGNNPSRWGKPLAALLGAFKAQKGLGVAAIGGKDSMSGSFEDIDVPPTLVSFAVTTDEASRIISPEYKRAGSTVALLSPQFDAQGLPEPKSQLEVFAAVDKAVAAGKVAAAWTPGFGGIAEGVMKMCFGNGIGFSFDEAISAKQIFAYSYGSFILELAPQATLEDIPGALLLGTTIEEKALVFKGQALALGELLEISESKLEPVFSCNIKQQKRDIPTFTYQVDSADKRIAAPGLKLARPKVLIPAFPGTNCEYDSARAFDIAGAAPQVMLVQNLSSDDVAQSVEKIARAINESQIVFIPGGFSGGDEPDGSGKFITAFFRNEAITQAVRELLGQRDGLMAGICNGFQALVKLGLVPYGDIVEAKPGNPTLTFNTIGRHQSKLVRVRLASNASPWLKDLTVGETYTMPISHGEGRFLASDELVAQLAASGQIATQYVDLEGNPTYDIHFNPNDSVAAIEGILSPDGRVFGKMGHVERRGPWLYKNVVGNFDFAMFESAVSYLKA